MQQPQLDLTKSAGLLCQKCEHTLFKEVFSFRKFSKFITGTPNDVLIPIPIYICEKCSEPLEEAIPVDVRPFFKNNEELEHE